MPQILNLLLLIPVGAAILLSLRIHYGRRPSTDGLRDILRVAGYLLCIAGMLALVIGLTLWGAIVFLPVAAVIAIGAYVRSRRGNDQALLASLAAGAEAGLSLEEIVAAFAAEHPGGRAALVSRGLHQGRSLMQALRCGGVHLPAATSAMLGTAETRGNLGPVLRRVLEPLRPLEAAVNAATQRVLLCLICAWVWLNTSVFLMLKIVPVLDKMFESQAGNVYYDINEGPLLTFDRLKRVWTAATTNFTISKFEFNDDMKIDKVGDVLVQTGTWAQTQVAKSGASRDIVGRVTVLWRKTGNEWRVFHYHGSITPPRAPAPPRPAVSPTATPQPPY
jgi:hypothetical protein